MYNLFPIVEEIHHPDLLQSFAHDLAYSAFPAANGSANIAFLYLTAINPFWQHIADIYVSYWEARSLLNLLCDLARCGTRIQNAIEQALKNVEEFDKAALLLNLIATSLKIVSRMNESVSGGTYKRGAKAFMIIHKLLLQVPLDKRADILREFYVEQMVFHFNFDYVYLQGVTDSVSHQFKTSVLASFPCSLKVFYMFASTLANFQLANFLYKYMEMFAIPMALLNINSDPRCQDVLQECFAYALAGKVEISLSL